MFVLIWTTLLFSVRGITADAGAAVKEHCDNGYCITLSEGEITAEAGLCVVIPCSFTTASGFTPQHMMWYKCEPYERRCVDSDVILHTKNSNKVQSGFIGRVSLLEPDVSLRNCSIIINDLTGSDSGSYQLRVQSGSDNGFTFSLKATVSVKGLTQKPTVMIPPLTEGQQTTLTCTAPGLCSGSDPNITWTWRGAGEKDSHITGNITAVTQRHSSTLTFNPSAEQHGTDVTCKVSFTNSITTEETVTLNVTYVKEFRITGNTSVKEGETLHLTCSVESFPPSLITWTKPSETNMQNGIETNWQNNTETFMQRERGIGTFSISNVTTEDSGRYICRAEYLNQTLVENVDVKVKYVRKPLITGDTTVEEGDALNLTCRVESFPPSHITWTVLGSNTKLDNGLDTDLQNHTGSATLVIPNVTTEDSGRYICRAEYLNKTLVENVDVKVKYVRKPLITGDTTVEEGDALNLTCRVESFPPSHITWTVLGSNTKLDNGLDTDLQNHTGSATLVIPNVTTEDSGRYICTAQHLDRTVTTYADVTVTWFSKILNNSGCEVESEVLTCVCISEGFPLPTINWPLLNNHTEYSVITTVSNHTVSSTVTLTVKDHSNTSVECVSSNENGEAKENLKIRMTILEKEKADQSKELVSWLEVIIAFLIGVLLSAVLCCLATKCHRKNQKISRNLDASLEMVTSQEAPLIDAGQAVDDDQTFYQDLAEGEEGAAAAEQAAPDLNGGPKDVEYASIDFSVLRRKNTRDAAKKQETTETEYAEIKKEVKEEMENNAEEQGYVLEGEMVTEDEETTPCVPEEDDGEDAAVYSDGEDAAVYSNVKDIMSEI
ncbi:Schwann cell myelin protein-like [Anarhichas minor]|uniref:Schwann cell myelin protein-like n=1 Tax=Anarhichas minor TaxID=65739 RepID=UPI003F740CF0